MGVQVVGEKKRKRAERETGLTIDRLLRLDNTVWEARVLHDDGHSHVRINRLTWVTAWQPPSQYGGCWSTCAELPPAQRVVRPIPFASLQTS